LRHNLVQITLHNKMFLWAIVFKDLWIAVLFLTIKIHIE